MSLRGTKRFEPMPMSMLAGLLAAAFLGGCSGAIGNSDSTSAEPSNPGNSKPGNSNPGSDPGNPASSKPPVLSGTDPGRVTIHRLNRTEYNNTVRDLLGTTLTPADGFVADDTGAGFNNLADALTLSPVHLEMYEAAAEALATDALGPQRAKNLTCDLVAMGDACVKQTVTALAKRAYRRPVTDAEITELVNLAAVAKMNGDDAEAGLKLAIELMLISPNFIFRVELDPDPTSLTPHPLSEYELASRLSYFLWSSMPDDQLFAAADAGNLHTPSVLQAQIARMMKDDKANALVDNFSGQWLFTRGLQDVAPDATKFPMFDPSLKDAMTQETQLLFRDIAFGGVSADKLLNADFTYLNDRLATHYGLPLPGSAAMKKVSVAGTPRGGLLSQGSILTVTSHADRTSPVNRGKAILTQILCATVPPPPQGVKTDLPSMMVGTTTRQLLESHRSNPTCAACHALMDPLGFGLENFDAVGAYRTTENGAPIDSTGQYADAAKSNFSGAHELSALVAKDDRFAPCVAKQLYTYGLGREPVTGSGAMDPSTIDVLAYNFANSGYQFATLLQQFISSDTFLKRRGDDTGGSP